MLRYNIFLLLIIGAAIILVATPCNAQVFNNSSNANWNQTPGIPFNATSPIWNATITPVINGANLFNNSTSDIMGGGDLSQINIDAALSDVFLLFTNILGPFFWVGLWGVIVASLYIKQESGLLPAILTLCGGVVIVKMYFPGDIATYAGDLICLVIAGIIYMSKKKR